MFGGVVPGAERQRDLATDRRDVDDGAGPMVAHARQDELHEPGRREQVHLKLIACQIEGYVFGRARFRMMRR